MRLTFADPGALWWLAAVPLVWLGLRFARTTFSSGQRVVQAAVRSLLLASLALALAQPVLSLASAGQSVVYLVDVSHSVSSRAIEAAAGRIDSLNAALRAEHSRILAFGGVTAPIENTAALRALASASPEGDPSVAIGREVSDIERALNDAPAALGAGLAPRLVLFSDGRETSGDARAAAMGLGARGIPVFVEPMTPRNLGDTWIDGIAVPPQVVTGGLVPVVVEVTSQRQASGTVELREGGRVLARRDATFAPGTTAVALEATFDSPGAQLVEATLTATGDPLGGNNSLTREVVVESRSRVLYIESQASSAKYLRGALEHAGLDVTVGTPREVPVTVAGLEPWDVVILSDLDRASISNASMSALASWVEREGGGLLVAGGANVFGVSAQPNVPGYRHTEIERLLPVTFERNDDPEVALVIVLDKSWSMAGQVIALCKAAAQAAIDALGDKHMVGVVTFNDAFTWDIPVREVGPNREAIRTSISNIEASGYTVIYPALEQAYDALRKTSARARHVVLLSDGKSSPAEYEALVRKMAAAKMTVSTLAVGPGADAFLLADIAKWGNGRHYVVTDPRQVAQIFVTEAKGATTPAFEEGKPIKPLLRSPAFLRGVDYTRMPPLGGRTATVLKEHAVEVLSTDTNDPLLTFWSIGLGRTAVFASDVKDRWGSAWTSWQGYGPFFAAVAHALERPRRPALEVTPGVVRGGTRSVAVAVEARDARGAYRDLLKPTLRVSSTDGTSAETSVRQVGPGRYEVGITADSRFALTVALEAREGLPAASRIVFADPAAEYRFRPPDDELLQAVATASGGQLAADAEAIRRAPGLHPASRHALWPVLVGMALLLWFADILLRRVRILEAVA